MGNVQSEETYDTAFGEYRLPMSSALSAMALVPPIAQPYGYRVLSVEPNSPATRAILLAVGYHPMQHVLKAHASTPWGLSREAQYRVQELDEPVQVTAESSSEAVSTESTKGDNEESTDNIGSNEEKSALPAEQEENTSWPSHEIVSYFDFIVRINGKPLVAHDGTFARELQANNGAPVRLDIYNLKADVLRAVQVVPEKWGGVGLLGMFVRFSSFEHASEHVLHITRVEEGSPAQMAGFVAGDDYILGAKDEVFDGVDDFLTYILHHAGDPVTLFLYSKSRDTVREQTIFITTGEWATGQTGLGCTVAQGHLHQLPNWHTLGKNEWLDRFARSRKFQNTPMYHEAASLEGVSVSATQTSASVNEPESSTVVTSSAEPHSTNISNTDAVSNVSQTDSTISQEHATTTTTSSVAVTTSATHTQMDTTSTENVSKEEETSEKASQNLSIQTTQKKQSQPTKSRGWLGAVAHWLSADDIDSEEETTPIAKSSTVENDDSKQTSE